MANPNVAIMKTVVCVAWADGLFKDQERRALEGLLAAAQLTPEEVDELRRYAAEPRTLADVDTSVLTPEDCKKVVILAVALAHADYDYSFVERQTILKMCERMGFSPSETHTLLSRANARIG